MDIEFGFLRDLYFEAKDRYGTRCGDVGVYASYASDEDRPL